MKRLFAMTLSLAVALTALNVLSVGAVQGITTTENDALPRTAPSFPARKSCKSCPILRSPRAR